MKKQYIAIGFGVVLLIAFMIGITYVFLQSYTAKGRYMPAASKPEIQGFNPKRCYFM
jgi:hypothetical protein